MRKIRSVATITKTGVLKGKTVGTVTITARYQRDKVTYLVNVKVDAKGFNSK